MKKLLSGRINSKKSKNRIDFKTEETPNGYALVENMFVMPVVFVVLFALLFAGCMLHAQCTIDAAARRGVRYAAKLVCDPQYGNVTAGAVDETKRDLTDLSSADFDFTSISSYKPYRYIPFLTGNYYDSLEDGAEEYTRKIISQNKLWMFTIDTDSVVCDVKNYFISQNVTMKITATYHMPAIFKYLGLPETYELTAADKFTVSDQDEFIRNVDFAVDLLGRVGKALGLDKPLGKMMDFVKKVFGG